MKSIYDSKTSNMIFFVFFCLLVQRTLKNMEEHMKANNCCVYSAHLSQGEVKVIRRTVASYDEMYIFIFNYYRYVFITSFEWVWLIYSLPFLLVATYIYASFHHIIWCRLYIYIYTKWWLRQNIDKKSTTYTQYICPHRRRRHQHNICGYSLFSSVMLKPSSY